MITTRFAPSPTGFLHIGGARTALFNWLYAKHHNGKFLLRIEDTDKKRSTEEAKQAIIEGLDWLGLHWDDDIIFQSERETRHVEVAHQLLKEGKAYHCYCSKEELEAAREEALKNKQPLKYNGKCRNLGIHEVPKDRQPVIRIKAPDDDGKTIIDDLVQDGQMVVANSQLDDLIILRSDGTPTYMLAVVVDDHDMNVTHVIRGDDHLTNAVRQTVIYDACGWHIPQFAHIPLIHGEDGAKMSKRHGAIGVEAYRDLGYLPEALRNYLLRLGWSHGDEEIISTEQAIKWFDFDKVGRSSSCFDFKKLDNLNGHYIQEADNERLLTLITPLLEKNLGHPVSDQAKTWLLKGMDGLKQRAKTLVELAKSAQFYAAETPLGLDEKAQKILDEDGKTHLPGILAKFSELSDWNHEIIEQTIRDYAETHEVKLGKVAGSLRVALTYSTQSPSMFEVIEILGKDETLRRGKHLI